MLKHHDSNLDKTIILSPLLVNRVRSELLYNQQDKFLISDKMSHPGLTSQLEEAALKINRLETLIDKREVKLHKSEKQLEKVKKEKIELVEKFTELNEKVNPMNVEKRVNSIKTNITREEKEIDMNSTERKTKPKCKYWNLGYCYKRKKYSFHYKDEDCQEYLKEESCNTENCQKTQKNM